MELRTELVAKAPILIEGAITRVAPSTSPGRLAWNVLNTVSLLAFAGGPYLGSAQVEVQLRVYRNKELLRTYNGSGEAFWRAHFRPRDTVATGKRAATLSAAHVAIIDAVSHMAADPPAPSS